MVCAVGNVASGMAGQNYASAGGYQGTRTFVKC